MKFIKLVVKSSGEDLDAIIENMDIASMDFMEKIYHAKQFLEFELTNGLGIMFASLCEYDVVKLMSIYVNYEINFTYEDITRSVLFGKIPELSTSEIELLVAPDNDNRHISDFAKNFIEDNLNEDIILEKIKENGIDSITPQDILVLENVELYVKKNIT